jgi:hypothetical protein
LAALLPVRLLASSLPLPLTAVVPVRVSCSTLAPRVKVTLLRTLSVPWLVFSMTRSPALST